MGGRLPLHLEEALTQVHLVVFRRLEVEPLHLDEDRAGVVQQADVTAERIGLHLAVATGMAPERPARALPDPQSVDAARDARADLGARRGDAERNQQGLAARVEHGRVDMMPRDLLHQRVGFLDLRQGLEVPVAQPTALDALQEREELGADVSEELVAVVAAKHLRAPVADRSELRPRTDRPRA